MNNRIALFGLGSQGLNCWKSIKKEQDFFNDYYVCFADNGFSHKAETFSDIPVISPNELASFHPDYIVITSSFYKEIRMQLISEFDISEDVIFSFPEYIRFLYCQHTYYARYNSSDKPPACQDWSMDKIVIYTAISGGYDKLYDPLFCDDNIDYVCFTDNPALTSDIWDIRPLPVKDLEPVRLAKIPKIRPDLFFPEYNVSVWVDAKYQITADVRDYIRSYARNTPILCFPHFERRCIYEEAAVCIVLKKGIKEQLIDQISTYHQHGYPFDNGLFEMGCIVRKHHNERVIALMKSWESEIHHHSSRDQISFPYVCQENQIVPDICDLYIEKNHWLQYHPHLYG